MIPTISKKDLYYGFLHLLVSFTSICVITMIVGFNLPAAFLFAGFGTLVFHYCTKNKLASIMGVSGSYIGGMIYVSTTYGLPYAIGGVFLSGIIYGIFALLFKFKGQKILSLFPKWLLHTIVLMIGLNLIPIGVNMISGHYVIGLVTALLVTILSLNNKTKMFSMPLTIVVMTVVFGLINGFDLSALSTPLSLEFITPQFNLAAFFSIAVIAIAVCCGELLGDIENTGSIQGIDAFKEVGADKVCLGNALSNFMSGLFGGMPVTSYSENASFLLQSGYKNPNAQLITGGLFIVLAFCTPILKLVMLIPPVVLGGIALYLYCLITMNAARNFGRYLKDDNKLIISTLMIFIFYLQFSINGVIISSIAVSTLFGILLNYIMDRKGEKNS